MPKLIDVPFNLNKRDKMTQTTNNNTRSKHNETETFSPNPEIQWAAAQKKSVTIYTKNMRP